MKARLLFAAYHTVLIVLVGIAIAHAQVWNWSQTSATNATVDPSINWAVGMAPSAVGASSRSEMAQIAKWRDDGTGSVVTSGGPTAYTLTSNQGTQGVATALTAGYRVCFSPNVTNGATVTLQVDSTAAKPLRISPGVELVGGEMRQGTPYCATYFTSNSGEYILNGIASQDTSIAVGSYVLTAATAVPSSKYLFSYGQEVSRSTYSALMAAITIQETATITNGSPTISNLSDTTQIPTGNVAVVEGTGIPGGTTITSCTPTTCTMSSNAAGNGSSITVFPYGDGNQSTTFNMPDCRGMSFAGRDNMGGPARGKLTATYAGANPDALGAALGSQSYTLQQANLGAWNFANSGIAINNGTQLYLNGGLVNACDLGVNCTGGSSVAMMYAGTATAGVVGVWSNASISAQGSAAAGGSGTPLPIVQPTLTANCMMRVLAKLEPINSGSDHLAANDDQPVAERVRQRAA